MPHFVTQRSLYEARERPSKTYSWKVCLFFTCNYYATDRQLIQSAQIFMLSSIIVELPWNALAATILFFTYYYPVGLYKNAIPTDSVAERGALFFLFCQQFLLFVSPCSTSPPPLSLSSRV